MDSCFDIRESVRTHLEGDDGYRPIQDGSGRTHSSVRDDTGHPPFLHVDPSTPDGMDSQSSVVSAPTTGLV